MRQTFILVLMTSCAAAVLWAAEPAQITSKQELKAAEANAGTPADYERSGTTIAPKPVILGLRRPKRSSQLRSAPVTTPVEPRHPIRITARSC